MSFWDLVPGVSQVKATVHLIAGDKEGAARTTERFFTKTPIIAHATSGIAKVCGDDQLAKECWRGGNSSLDAVPVVGHVKAVGHGLVGDDEGADRALESANRTTSGMLNSTPGVGHGKAIYHYLRDENEKGDEAMLAATRTTTVMGAGAAGFVVGGPAGAVGLGMAAGAEWDLGTAAVTKGRRVNGIARIIDKPKEVESYFDAAGALVGDGMTGYAGGKLAERTIRRTEINAAENLKSTRQSKGFDANKSVAPERTREIYCEATDMKTGRTYSGVNESVRKSYGDPAPRPNEFLKQHSNIQAPLKRHPGSCAENQALHKMVTDPANPNASAASARLTTMEVRPNGDVYNIQRCDNCVAYKDVVGSCTTDKIPRRIPGSTEFVTRGGGALGGAAAVASRAGRAAKSSKHQH